MTIEELKAFSAAATPRPWVYEEGEFHSCVKIGEVYLQSPYQPPDGRGRCEKQRADGRLIASACNSHDALLAVAEAAETLCTMTHPRPDFNADTRLRAALAALAALEKEPKE